MTFIWCHAAPRPPLYISPPLLPIFLSSLALSITCHAPAIFPWPFPQTDGTGETVLLAHMSYYSSKLIPCSFFVSERYLFNKWIFNLPVAGTFFLLGVDVKNHSERDKQRPWQSGKVLVLFFLSLHDQGLYHWRREPEESLSPSEFNLAEGHFFIGENIMKPCCAACLAASY